MTRRLKFAAAALAVLVPTIGIAGPAEDIAARGEAYEAAFAAGDAAGMAAIYAEDAVLLPDDMERLEGRDAAEAIWKSYIDAGLADLRNDTVALDVVGDTAIEHGTWSISVPDGKGGMLPETGKFLTVWQQKDGDWFMHWDIWNSDPTE